MEYNIGSSRCLILRAVLVAVLVEFCNIYRSSIGVCVRCLSAVLVAVLVAILDAVVTATSGAILAAVLAAASDSV